jgi:type I restriction enzyme M protein
MLNAETKRRLDACRDVLVGKLPLPTDQIELITLALIYKFMDDLDEESVRLGGKRSFFVGPLEKYRWRALLPQTVSADERMNLFAEGIEAIGKAEHLPGLFRDVFRNSFLKFRDGRILTLFLNEVNAFEYSHSEEIGNAFEYLLKTMGIQAENGQFRTPRHIINFMVECLDPQPNDRILDPACGTGGFLVSAYKHILAQHTSPGSKIPGDKLTHDQRQKVYSNLTGYDVTDLMVKLSKVNLFLHGFPDPAIHIYDTLTNDARWNEKADLILANPPFMTPKGGVSPHTKFRVAAKKSEVLFTDYIAEHLTPDGRGAVIVPNGIVATTQNAYVKLRRFLIEDSLVAVVSLPSGVFKPYSGVKTSILLLDKKLARQRQAILFLKVNADGFDLGDKRLPIDANDLPEAQRVFAAWVTSRVNDLRTELPWKAVEKQRLLSDRNADLIAERFTDAPSATSQYKPIRLGDVCERIMDGTHFSPKNQAEGKYRYVTAKNIKQMRLCLDDVTYISEEAHREIYRRCPVKKGDVLYIKDGATTGIAAINTLEEEFSLLSSVAVLRGKEDVLDNRFLAYWLNSPHGKSYMLGMVAGVAITRLTLAKLNEALIPLPPIEEQRRIVKEIDRYQSEIVGLESEIAEKRSRMEATIDAVWRGNSRDGNGSKPVGREAQHS